MRITSITSPSMFLTLPSELIEAILIYSCSPRAVASVAQTCRASRALIYASPDSHLWRGLFLTIWDDPHPALEHCSLLDPRINTTWDWGIEYRRRVSADRWLKAWRRDICPDDEIPTGKVYKDTDWYTPALSVLSTVLNTLFTLQPFPAVPPIEPMLPASTILPYCRRNVQSDVDERRERMTSAPSFPPLLFVLAGGVPVFKESRSGVHVGRIVYGPHTSLAPAAGLVPVPMPSLPPQLVRTLLASHPVGVRGLPEYEPFLFGVERWGDDALADIFHRIICATGFVPIPPPLVSISRFTSTSESDSDHARAASSNRGNKEDTEHGLGAQGDGEHHEEHGHREPFEQSVGHIPDEEFPTPLQQHADARLLARRRVYDMRYLRADRLWGPFHPVTRDALRSEGPEITRPEVDKRGKPQRRKQHASTSGSALGNGGINIEPDEFDSKSDDEKEEDWHSAAGPSRASFFSSNSGDLQRGLTDSDEDMADTDPDWETESTETEPEHTLNQAIPASTITDDAEPITNTASTIPSRRTRRSNPRLPPNSFVSPRNIKPQHLRPDYVYLASVRIILEANLRELFKIDISDSVEVPMSEMGMHSEDEDEILGAPAGSSEPASSSYRSSSSTMTLSNVPISNASSTYKDLANVFSRFQNLEVARLGSACGYWGGWIEQQQKSAMRDFDSNAGALSERNIRTRKSGIVAHPDQLEKPITDTTIIGYKGKGKERDSEPISVPALAIGPRDWEIGSEGEACEGWDWAGVTGIWRSSNSHGHITYSCGVHQILFRTSLEGYGETLTYLDRLPYSVFNIDLGKFRAIDQEACHIIPMEIRITGYTRAGPMPVHGAEPARDSINTFPSNKKPKTTARTGYFRPPPVIHFSGFSIGSDRDVNDGRTVKGSVQLIGGGEVRWQMNTYVQESNLPGTLTPEWSSEAVQVGGIGSTVGILGMWTGARHERDDPLGPFWAWKVSQGGPKDGLA